MSLLDLAEPIRYGPVQAVMFGVGLLILAAGGFMAAGAIRRSGRLSRWSGYVLAVGLALFIPQFYGPPAVRIAHGVLVGVGCMLLAVSMWRSQVSQQRVPA